MRKILVSEIMIPLQDYVTVKEDETLFDLFQLFERGRADWGMAHRDAIVVDKNGEFMGKVTMIDIFKALEPNYKKLIKNYTGGTLDKRPVIEAIKDLNLWMEPIQDICQRGARLRVAEVMHRPSPSEFLQESDSLEKALNEYVMGAHQPLVVKNREKITGILRFSDLFEIVRKEMLSCQITP